MCQPSVGRVTPLHELAADAFIETHIRDLAHENAEATHLQWLLVLEAQFVLFRNYALLPQVEFIIGHSLAYEVMDAENDVDPWGLGYPSHPYYDDLRKWLLEHGHDLDAHTDNDWRWWAAMESEYAQFDSTYSVHDKCFALHAYCTHWEEECGTV